MTQLLQLRAAAVAFAMTIPHFAAAQTAPAIPPSITTPDKVESSIGTLEYKDGAPSKETVAKAYDYLDLMHGVEAFVNAYQGASVASIFKGMRGCRRPEQHGPDLLGADGCEVPVPDGQCGHHLFLGQSGCHQGADRR